jgi:hypothetical protein
LQWLSLVLHRHLNVEPLLSHDRAHVVPAGFAMKAMHLGFLAWLLCAQFIQAAVAASSSEPAPLDEVLIEGRRATSNELVQQIVKVENRFYERYNALNDKDEFDVNCARDAAAGTRVQGRSCRAVYQENAERTEGQASYWWHYETFDLGASGGGPTGERKPVRASPAPVPAMLAILARRDEFRRTMVEVTSRNPELIQLLQQRTVLVKRYEAGLRSSVRR